MEVCGGPHPHDLPARDRAPCCRRSIELVHGPGCPVCVIPMGRVDDAMWLAGAAERHLHHVRRHDAGAREHGSSARGEGARLPTSGSSTRRWTRCKIAVDNPDKEVVFFAVGFETTAPSTAVTLVRAKDLGVTNFTVFCNHVTIVPPIKAILDSPDLRLSGFLGPGHVSTVVGNRPYRFVARGVRQADRGGRLRAARHPAVGPHAAGAAARGPVRGGEPVLPGGARRGQSGRRWRCWPRSSSCGRTSSGAGSGSSARAP